jgi:predicted membrane-bound spermidine synthase
LIRSLYYKHEKRMNDSPGSAGGKAALFFTVFVTGAAVMVIELLGTRLIAPFYGASLYVWSSLISVTMIALALGYFMGGRWADRARRTGLSLIIALAAVLTLAIPWATRSVLLATDPLGLRLGAFISALVLFSPSLTLLGMVGPFAIKLSTSTLAAVGNSAGSIYAVSTLGSVVGTLVLGFFLFPLIGSREILVGTGLLLLGLSLIVGLLERGRLGAAKALLPTLLLGVIGLGMVPKVLSAGHAPAGDKFRVRSERESLYGWVRVIDDSSRRLRLLTSDASAIGAASLVNGESVLSYQDIVGLIPALRPPMQRGLIVGLGAGHMGKVLYDRYRMVTDSLEIDPAVSRAAEDHFAFRPTGKVIVGDARYEIRHLTGPYDLIILDCFTGGSEPAHLMTVETLEQLRGLLSERGILAVNFVAFSQGANSLALNSVSRTLAQALPHQAVFISEPGKEFTDFIFLAGRQPIDIHAPSLSSEQTAWLQERVFPVDPALGTLLTDNLNPLEHLQIAKSEHYRRFLVDMFGGNLFVR